MTKRILVVEDQADLRGILRDRHAVPPLIAALRDPDVNVRHAAAAAAHLDHAVGNVPVIGTGVQFAAGVVVHHHDLHGALLQRNAEHHALVLAQERGEVGDELDFRDLPERG